MSKELEALHTLCKYIEVEFNSDEHYICREAKKVVGNALQRLEAIDNAKSSEALKELNRIDYNIAYLLSDCDINEEVSMNFNSIRDNKSCEVIKQALLKAQEQEKVLNIIKKKKVELFTLYHSKDVNDYNSLWNNDMYCLTQEEYDLLKEVLK